MPYKDPEKAREYHRDYRREWDKAHPYTEEQKARKYEAVRRWKAAHPNYQREWRKAHPGYQRDRYRDDPEAYKAKAAKWTRDNPQWSAFTDQQRKAKHRGIEFLLTFGEWWTIWETSGKWEQRGCRKGQYVMARHGDIGPYQRDNVRICTVSDNYADRRPPNVGRRKPKGGK
jgi:hypothetical protein